ncbi:hypothetical protein WSM22_25870 [Cytophagales bacterium WSM2-2]|nr:hypothetical protein WSM22_25870 [Cytophagales bacterium WSM2-2]
MKTVIAGILTICSFLSLSAQDFEKKVAPFKRIIASPKINVVLVPGAEESVKIRYSNIDPSKINVTVRNKTLRIYLDGSRFLEKRVRENHDGITMKRNAYRHASITAYVTYSALQKLIVRGEQNVDVQGAIVNKKFKLSAYGACQITFDEIVVSNFKAALYGEHDLKVRGGTVEMLKYKLFGENKIDTQSLRCAEILSSTFGESRMKVNAEENLRLRTFGESQVLVRGGAEVDKFTFGELSVRK